MKHDLTQPAVVVLSRRNVLSLLHKLDMEGSARTLVSGDGRLTLQVEDDHEHYDRPAGTMHPDTEEFIEANS